MMYFYAICVVVSLIAIASAVRWFNLPKTIEQRRLQAEEKTKRRNERIERRRKLFRLR